MTTFWRHWYQGIGWAILVVTPACWLTLLGLVFRARRVTLKQLPDDVPPASRADRRLAVAALGVVFAPVIGFGIAMVVVFGPFWLSEAAQSLFSVGLAGIGLFVMGAWFILPAGYATASLALARASRRVERMGAPGLAAFKANRFWWRLAVVVTIAWLVPFVVVIAWVLDQADLGGWVSSMTAGP